MDHRDQLQADTINWLGRLGKNQIGSEVQGKKFEKPLSLAQRLRFALVSF